MAMLNFFRLEDKTAEHQLVLGDPPWSVMLLYILRNLEKSKQMFRHRVA
jgi:hypothetical protein